MDYECKKYCYKNFIFKHWFMILPLISFLIFVSESAYGLVEYNAKDPFGTAFCLLYYKRNRTIRAIAIIAGLAFGIQALRGKISWTMALIVCTGIIIIIMADIIVRSIIKNSIGDGGYICR